MNEKISALMDGELDERAGRGVIDALGGDAAAREAWGTYHLIGDAMRGTAPLQDGFAARVAWRLAEEPTVLAPRPLPRAEPRRWFAASAVAASVAAVALVGWVALAPQPQPVSAPAPMAKAPVVEAPKPAIVPLPSGTNDYLLAHQGFSPRLSLQGMAPYVRTVSDQRERAR
jgi:sigma-E factor negative regulatory protein RseA